MKNRVLNNQLWWLPGFMVLSCLVISCWPTIEILAKQWISNEDYSHGILIVPISAYLIWEKRKVLKTVNVGSDWRALPLMIFSIMVFIVGELGAELFTTRASMLILVIASIWLLYGAQVVKVLRFPLAFLFLMLPLPGFIYRNLTFPLQIFSSTWAVKLLQFLGISSYREGNVIDMGFTQFQVVEACNGLRFILPLFTLGVLFAFLGQRSIWKQSVLILATILATTPLVNYLGHVPPKALEKSLQTFPVKFNGWSGKMSKIDDKIWEQVGGQEYVVIDYFKKDQNPVNFYIAFYEYQRKAGDFIHSPKLCLPGSGWFIEIRARGRNKGEGSRLHS